MTRITGNLLTRKHKASSTSLNPDRDFHHGLLDNIPPWLRSERGIDCTFQIQEQVQRFFVSKR